MYISIYIAFWYLKHIWNIHLVHSPGRERSHILELNQVVRESKTYQNMNVGQVYVSIQLHHIQLFHVCQLNHTYSQVYLHDYCLILLEYIYNILLEELFRTRLKRLFNWEKFKTFFLFRTGIGILEFGGFYLPAWMLLDFLNHTAERYLKTASTIFYEYYTLL